MILQIENSISFKLLIRRNKLYPFCIFILIVLYKNLLSKPIAKALYEPAEKL